MIMQKFFRCIVMAALIGGSAATAYASELQLTIANGRVTLVATDVPVRQILSEWARVGQTQIVNGEKVVGPNVTLQLVDVPEAEALDIVLRSAAGYMVAPRTAAAAGNSSFGRIMILATSRPPAATAVAQTPAPFNTRQALPQPQPVPVDDDAGEPSDQGVVPPPGMMPQPNVQSQPGMPVQQPMVQPYPGGNVPQAQPQQPQQPPVLSRPGMLPPPNTPGTPNPYIPGRPPVTRPGGGGGEGQ
jgi:hypothetical protein